MLDSSLGAERLLVLDSCVTLISEYWYSNQWSERNLLGEC